MGGPDVGNGIALGINGNAYVTGALQTGMFTSNAYAAKFDPFCNWICTGILHSFAGGRDIGKGITVNEEKQKTAPPGYEQG